MVTFCFSKLFSFHFKIFKYCLISGDTINWFKLVDPSRNSVENEVKQSCLTSKSNSSIMNGAPWAWLRWYLLRSLRSLYTFSQDHLSFWMRDFTLFNLVPSHRFILMYINGIYGVDLLCVWDNRRGAQKRQVWQKKLILNWYLNVSITKTLVKRKKEVVAMSYDKVYWWLLMYYITMIQK